MAPADVSLKDESHLRAVHQATRTKIAPRKIRFKIGDYVCISKLRSVFSRGFTPNWSTEIFKVIEVCKTSPVTYKLVDATGQPIMGGFYAPELQRTKHPTTFLIDKVLRKQKNKHYVHFLGLLDSQNQWINVNAYV